MACLRAKGDSSKELQGQQGAEVAKAGEGTGREGGKSAEWAEKAGDDQRHAQQSGLEESNPQLRQQSGRRGVHGSTRTTTLICSLAPLLSLWRTPPAHPPTPLPPLCDLLRAMGGSVKFEDALAARLGIMQPTKAKLDEFLEVHPAKLSPGE